MLSLGTWGGFKEFPSLFFPPVTTLETVLCKTTRNPCWPCDPSWQEGELIDLFNFLDFPNVSQLVCALLHTALIFHNCLLARTLQWGILM